MNCGGISSESGCFSAGYNKPVIALSKDEIIRELERLRKMNIEKDYKITR
jgi:hypothetical protein